MKKLYKSLKLRQLSETLAKAELLREINVPRSGWLRTIRTALDMPQGYVAKRLGVSPTAIAKYERGEAEESIQIGTLRKAANAMNCDLVYAILPRESLDDIRLARAVAVARRTVGSVAQTMSLEGQSLPSDAIEARVTELARLILAERPRSIWDS